MSVKQQSTPAKLPPMLRQYLGFKESYSDCVILIQVGDFYEAFFEDAETIARVLNVTLTSRSKNSPNPIPMAGVPISVVDAYANRLVDAGFSVALVSQKSTTTDGKVTIGRELERIITPGQRLFGNDENIEGLKSSVIASVFLEGKSLSSDTQDVLYCISYTEVQTGVVFVYEGKGLVSLLQDLQKLEAVEVILPKDSDGLLVDRRQHWVRSIENFQNTCVVKFRNFSQKNSLNDFDSVVGLEVLSPLEKKSTNLLLEYIDEITISTDLPVKAIEKKNFEGIVSIDATTRLNLDLVSNARSGAKQNSLFGVLDRTKTLLGAKLLQTWILNPLTSIEFIRNRQEVVAFFISEFNKRGEVAEFLKFMVDCERLAARIELGLISPIELSHLRTCLLNVPKIIDILDGDNKVSSLRELALIKADLKVDSSLASKLLKTISDNPPRLFKDGGIFAEGFNSELDELRSINTNGKSFLVELEAREREKTGINSLKVKYNSVLGYYLDITKVHKDKIPEDYRLRQETTNGLRYYTDELKALEQKILSAQSKIINLEKQLYESFKVELLPFCPSLRKCGNALAKLDVFQSLAECAEKEAYVRPEIDDSEDLILKEARHPVLSSTLGQSFIPNSIELEKDKTEFVLITGANMGGKSTYLRQTALVTILAQIGSFVPAGFARVGVVDQIFARLGASDDIAEGESTFMVEMREASSIIKNATSKSLVLIDEIGRGTATSDGLVIAQSVLEWLLERVGCRCLFATHFHELTNLSKRYNQVKNISVGSLDSNNQVVFTHKMQQGAASNSYGIEVACLAGLPDKLIERARELLSLLGINSREANKKATTTDSQLSIFSEVRTKEIVKEPNDYKQLQGIKELLLSKNVNELRPIEALQVIEDLQLALESKDSSASIHPIKKLSS